MSVGPITRVRAKRLKESFGNLAKLIVKDCSKLTYLCSLSVAQSLNKLKGLFVSECRMMEKLFNAETNSNEFSKVRRTV